MTYYIYSRLNVPVSASDSDVMDALDSWADTALRGGRAALPVITRAGVLIEHHDAQDLYDFVQRGC